MQTRSRQSCAGIWHYRQARCDRLERNAIRQRRYVQVRPHRRHGEPSAWPCSRQTLRRQRHFKVLPRLGSLGAHRLEDTRRQATAGDERLAAGGLQPEGRHRPTGCGPPAQRRSVLCGGRHLRFARRRALLRSGPESGRLSRSSRARRALLERLSVSGRAQHLRALLITNKGYGLLWDNASKTTIEPGFNEQTRWSSEVGQSRFLFRDRRQRPPMRSSPDTSCSPAPPTCCPRRRTATSSASSATRRRRRCCRWPKAIAIAICPPTCWWWTGSTTPRWGRWISIPSTGPIPRP